MCIIIIKQKGKDVPTEVLKTSARIQSSRIGNRMARHIQGQLSQIKKIFGVAQHRQTTLHTSDMQRLVKSARQTHTHLCVATIKMSC